MQQTARGRHMAALLLTALCRVSAAAPAPGADARPGLGRLPLVTVHPTAVTAWKAALLDVDRDGKEEILYAGYGRAEAVISLGPVLCVMGRDGDVLYCRRCLRDMAFTHLSASPAAGELVLGSLVGASDRSVYRLRFVESAKQNTDEIEGLSPVVLRLHEPHRGLLRNTDGNVEDFKPDPDARRGLLTGYWWWALCRTHPAYFSSYALNVRNYGHDFIPETPYGLPTVVPHWTPADKLSWATEIIDTDGVFVLEGGRKRTAAESKEKILRLFEKQSEKLAVRASGGYCMARRRAADELRVVIVDHGVFSPQPRDRTVAVRIPDGLQIDAATDVLTGHPFTLATPNRFPVPVPAGAFRTIDVRVKR